jgi:hypothetical protein
MAWGPVGSISTPTAGSISMWPTMSRPTGSTRNRGDGGFEDIGASVLAADYRGATRLAVGDHERDGDPDLFVTHWVAQENAFFENMFAEDILDEAGRRRLFFMDSADTPGWARSP